MLRRRNWLSIVTILVVILLTLLTIQSALSILSAVAALLARFSQAILLFILGLILAYILAPAVNGMQRLVRKRWAAILSVYIGVLLGMAILGALLFAPFVSQGRSLANQLQQPSRSSLKALDTLLADSKLVRSNISRQASPTGIKHEIAGLEKDLANVAASREQLPTTSGPLGGGTAQTGSQQRIPPSYITPMRKTIAKLRRDFNATVPPPLKTRTADARKLVTTVSETRATVGSSPVAVLELQGWLDDHGLTFDLYAHFGTAIQQLNNQVANILSQAVRIILTAGNLLVNTVLALIISIYFLSDGRRLIRKGIAAAPAGQRENAEFFVHSLDRVMGSYLRGQLLLAGLAGMLGGLGAWALGVPYPVLIGFSTFFLSLVPVIGAVILIVPPVAIALLFTSFATAIILLVYFLVFMQIVTNIIGPRVMGSAVGIHPLEAMAAALVGYPLAGFLGSFFAVPIVGFLHILLKEIHRHFVAAGKQDAVPADTQTAAPSPTSTPVPAPAAPTTTAE